MASLFGNKPAGGSLFGNAAPSPNPGASLFGAPNSQPPTSGSLFGNTTPNQTPSTAGSLFGAPAQSSGLFGGNAPQAGQQSANAGAGNLFGSSAQNTNPPAGSLFGNTASNQSSNFGAQASSGNLFGGNPAPQAGNSLFGNTGAQNAPQANTSLFGNNSTQNAPQATNSLFGNTSTQNATQASTSLFSKQGQTGSLFNTAGSINVGNKQDASGQNGLQQQSQSLAARASVSQPAYFDSLLEKSKMRHGAADADQALPSLQLGLGDIAKRVRGLGSVVQQAPDSRAHYLLAASGINPGSTRRDIDLFSDHTAAHGSVRQSTEWDPDSLKHVEQLQQRQTVRMVTESLERAQHRFNQYLEDSVDINWEEQRRKIYAHFGLASRDQENSSAPTTRSFGTSRRSKAGKSGSSLQRSIFGQSGIQKSVIGTPGPNQAPSFSDIHETGGIDLNDRSLREKQRRYAVVVQNLNQARLRKGRFLLVDEFLKLETLTGSDSPRQIADAYRALSEICAEDKATERQWADLYAQDSPKVRKMILTRSRAWLEKAFFEQVDLLVGQNPKDANLGGIPTALNKVRAYVRIRAGRKDLAPDGLELAVLNGEDCWALLFYLLRCGMVQEAAEYVVSNVTHFKTIDRNIITFITAYAKSADQRLEGRLLRECHNVYSAMTKVAPGDSVDPYKIAVYKLIGRCELSRRNLDTVCRGIDDWIWLQFALAREVNRAEENAGDVFGLQEVQATIREIGQRYFAQSADGFATFFYLQMLGGMFEQAIAYLYSHSYLHAVHFAIALNYYGLLRVAPFGETGTALLKYNTKEQAQINFGRMMGFYTRDFRADNVEAAVDYLVLLCLSAQAELCHEALRELVLESREFATLLGDLRSDGSRIPGIIEKRMPLLSLSGAADFINAITVQAASVADDNGRITDAVLLYHLSEDFDNVISIINRALSDDLMLDVGVRSTPLQPLKPRTAQAEAPAPQGSSLSLIAVDEPYSLAQNLLQLYSHNGLYAQHIRPMNRESCHLLVRLYQAKDRVGQGKWAEAYEIIQDVNLLPLKCNGNTTAIRNVSTNFNSLPTPIARLLGPLVLWTILCISHEREILAQRQYTGTSKELDQQYRGAARDLMVFAGLVKYRLSEKVWEAICGVAGDTQGF